MRTNDSGPNSHPISPTMDKHEKKTSSSKSEGKEESDVSNEYVLNFAFISFVLFTMLQFIFALAARSQSMLTDCAAMTVDCVSYLINCLAERLKHTKIQKKEDSEQHVTSHERHYRKKMRLLILELAPPFISVATLIAVTVIAIQQAVEILLDTDKGTPPNLGLMLLFSALNFVLDGVNVLCFARADHATGLSKGLTAAAHPQEYVHEQQNRVSERISRRKSMDSVTPKENVDENTHLLSADKAAPTSSATNATTNMEDSDEESDGEESSRGLNLNMCSAWTHICADTLRSIAVLVAAGFASLFPSLLSPADADSYGAIVVSIIIIISLGPLFEGLYFTAWEIYHLHREHKERQLGHPDEVVMALSV